MQITPRALYKYRNLTQTRHCCSFITHSSDLSTRKKCKLHFESNGKPSKPHVHGFRHSGITVWLHTSAIFFSKALAKVRNEDGMKNANPFILYSSAPSHGKINTTTAQPPGSHTLCRRQGPSYRFQRHRNGPSRVFIVFLFDGKLHTNWGVVTSPPLPLLSSSVPRKFDSSFRPIRPPAR